MSINSVEDKIRKARIKFIRRDFGLNYFGVLSYKFQWVMEEDMPDDIEGCVKFNLQNKTSIEDGCIHINRKYVERPDYTVDNLLALIIHELLHILRKDGMRLRPDKEEYAVRLACEHMVERDVKELSSIRPYQGIYNMIDELHSQQPQCTFEEAYQWILKNIKQNKITITINADENGNMSSLSVKDSTGRKDKEFNIEVNSDSQKNDEKNNPMVEQIVSQARAILETMKEKGQISGSLGTKLSKLLAVKIPWNKLLEKAIKTNVIQKPDDRSWKTPNKFYLPIGIFLPGEAMSDIENVGKLILLVDSSGSINDNDLSQFANVIVQSFKYFQNIIVIVHDSTVKDEQKYEHDESAKFLSYIRQVGFKGRGGTSHDPAFARIQTMWNTNGFKDELSMVISLTDNYSDIKSVHSKYKWLKSTPLVLVLTKNHSTESYNNPNITSIVMHDD